MLKLDDVLLRQGDFTLRADLTVPSGSRVALIGPSGAGKSTLIQAIAGFLKPVSGKIIWQDKVLNDLPPQKRPVSIIFQDNNLFPHLSAFENVALGIRPDLRLSAQDKSLVLSALEKVGLRGLGTRKPAQLSGGQQSRVALARLLAQNKPLVLLDEPFAALGPALKNEMLDLVARLCDETGATLLMVTHDPADALRIADLAIVVGDGQAHAPRPTAALLADPPEVLRHYLGG